MGSVVPPFIDCDDRASDPDYVDGGRKRKRPSAAATRKKKFDEFDFGLFDFEDEEGHHAQQTRGKTVLGKHLKKESTFDLESFDFEDADEEQVKQVKSMITELEKIKKELQQLKGEKRANRTNRAKKSRANSSRKKKTIAVQAMSEEQKQKLYSDIVSLPSDKLSEMLQLIYKICPQAVSCEGEEAEIEITNLDDEALWELHSFCQQLHGAASSSS